MRIFFVIILFFLNLTHVLQIKKKSKDIPNCLIVQGLLNSITLRYDTDFDKNVQIQIKNITKSFDSIMLALKLKFFIFSSY
ncbi:hypothetical protein BpHYR1_049233 [Brachionus plicatilis]|uniref:Uncharacterized protein n=1 Tax=Brachionus plicatilis TaxID=10195 RepID=A0A3M7RX34_BRAPC|nr:hypothetical protein BpHYR1_049233 [Brachionus plicatilis]